MSGDYGLQGRGLSRSQIGVAIEGCGKTVGKLPAPCDALGHIVREGAESEDGKAEEVDVDLFDWAPPPVSSSHVTSRRIIGLDNAHVKE